MKTWALRMVCETVRRRWVRWMNRGMLPGDRVWKEENRLGRIVIDPRWVRANKWFFSNEKDFFEAGKK